MKKIYIIFMTIFSLVAFAQGENDNWYFGQFAGLNFSNPTPIILTDSQMSALESCGTVSASNGGLLFYCSPNYIVNREHQVMQNGGGLLSSGSSQQLAIVKNPSNTNQYIVFTTGENATGQQNNNRIRYSIVDMSLGSPGLNGLPLGAVLPNAKNITVVDNNGNSFFSEAITVVKGNTDDTYWILIPNGNNLYSYMVDNQGFDNGNPVISSMNFPVPLNTGRYYSIKASPKVNNSNFSNYICVSNWYSIDLNTGISTNTTNNRVMAFNATTGTLSNSYSLNVNGIQSYLPEFNQNASVLFLGYQSIFAIDLLNSTTGNVISMQMHSYNALQPTGIQRNKEGDIYLARYNSNFLGRINNPNTYSSNLSVTQDAINLGIRYSSYGLPQLIQYFEIENYYPCINNLILNSTETNNNFVYNVGNDIVTKTNYFIANNQQITMNAGNSITLLPNSNIESNNFLAKIIPCDRSNIDKQGFQEILNLNQTNMVLNLDKEERKISTNKIDMFPNPVSDILNIKSKDQIKSVEIFDMAGRKINAELNNNTINVKELQSGSYILSVETANGKSTQKFIKK